MQGFLLPQLIARFIARFHRQSTALMQQESGTDARFPLQSDNLSSMELLRH
jgi:hypothetical protein